MKTVKLFFALFAIVFLLSSCSNSSDNSTALLAAIGTSGTDTSGTNGGNSDTTTSPTNPTNPETSETLDPDIEFTRFIIPKVDIANDEMVMVTLAGENFPDSSNNQKISDFLSKISITCPKNPSIVEYSYFSYNDIYPPVLVAYIENPHEIGIYDITVSYGEKSITTTLSAQDYSEYHTGDLLLNDGTIIPCNKDTYNHNFTYIDETIKKAVGILYGFNNYGAPLGWLGIDIDGGYERWRENIYNDWTTIEGYCDSNFIKLKKDIACDPNKTTPSYFSTDANTATFYGGDIDGSDNWDCICAFDPVGTADAATNYPAFNYVNNYADIHGLTGDYATGWYMPSIAELCNIYKNKDIIDKVLDALNTAQFAYVTSYKQSRYLSSSISIDGFDRYGFPFACSFEDGHIDNVNQAYVCCTRAFDINGINYTIKIDSPQNGTVDVNSTTAAVGSTVTLTATPANGYKLKVLTVEGSDHSSIQTSGTGNTRTFTMPAKNVTVRAIFFMPPTGDYTVISDDIVTFGMWPQTIKAENVTITGEKEWHGSFYCYEGSDGEWYVSEKENGYDSSYKYSDGTPVAERSENSYKWFKMEPIQWRVLTTNYGGKKLLLATKILTAGIPYYQEIKTRKIYDSQNNAIYIYPNNYMYSTIRAYLNGKYERDDTQEEQNRYRDRGFLQSAFTSAQQEAILTTTVDNSADSTTDADGKLTKATPYACNPTYDKIFLLSEKEVTTREYGLAPYYSAVYEATSARSRAPTDFAKARGAFQSTEAYINGGVWWLRSPWYLTGNTTSNTARTVVSNGEADSYDYVDGKGLSGKLYHDNYIGIVPALCVSN